jgi:hypothetical protein
MKAKPFLGPLYRIVNREGEEVARFRSLVPLDVRQKLMVVFNVWMQQQGKKRDPLGRVDLRIQGPIEEQPGPDLKAVPD